MALSPWDSALGAIEDSISQCTFLQRTYTAENPHADGSASPGARPLFRTPRRRDPHATSPAPTTTGWGKIDVLSSVNGSSTVVLQQRCHRTSASARSPSAHAPPPPAAGTHSPDREDSAPHWEQNFVLALFFHFTARCLDSSESSYGALSPVPGTKHTAILRRCKQIDALNPGAPEDRKPRSS